MRCASAGPWLRHAHRVLGCNIAEMVNVACGLVQAGDSVFREALGPDWCILFFHQLSVYWSRWWLTAARA